MLHYSVANLTEATNKLLDYIITRVDTIDAKLEKVAEQQAEQLGAWKLVKVMMAGCGVAVAAIGVYVTIVK